MASFKLCILFSTCNTLQSSWLELEVCVIRRAPQKRFLIYWFTLDSKYNTRKLFQTIYSCLVWLECKQIRCTLSSPPVKNGFDKQTVIMYCEKLYGVDPYSNKKCGTYVLHHALHGCLICFMNFRYIRSTSTPTTSESALPEYQHPAENAVTCHAQYMYIGALSYAPIL